MYDKSLSYGSVICQIAAPIVIEYAQNAIDTFSIVSVIEVQVSSDFSYADVLVTSEKNSADLPAYLAPLAHRIQRAIGKQTAARKVPKIRFRL
jgi:ribosome-binding factor A